MHWRRRGSWTVGLAAGLACLLAGCSVLDVAAMADPSLGSESQLTVVNDDVRPCRVKASHAQQRQVASVYLQPGDALTWGMLAGDYQIDLASENGPAATAPLQLQPARAYTLRLASSIRRAAP